MADSRTADFLDGLPTEPSIWTLKLPSSFFFSAPNPVIDHRKERRVSFQHCDARCEGRRTSVEARLVGVELSRGVGCGHIRDAYTSERKRQLKWERELAEETEPKNGHVLIGFAAAYAYGSLLLVLVPDMQSPFL